jgi:hypothetical protein
MRRSNSSRIRTFFESVFFRRILYGILAAIILLLTFRTGMILGYQKALFSFRSRQDYQKVFLGQGLNQDFDQGQSSDGRMDIQGFSANFVGDAFFNDHGVVGQIIQINHSGESVNSLTNTNSASNSAAALSGTALDTTALDITSLIIKGFDGSEHSILVGPGTIIRQFKNTIQLSSLKEGDTVAVIGSPNDTGQIEAKLIRYLSE